MAEFTYIFRRRGGGSAGQFQSPVNNELDEQIVTGGLPPGTESTRKGKRWSTMSTAAVAGLVIRPSTTAAFEIYNGSATKSLIVERLFYFNLVSTALQQAFNGWAQVTAPKAAPTNGSFTVRGSSGQAYNGVVIAAASTTVVDSGWFPWTAAVVKGPEATSVIPHGVAIARVGGSLIVPPLSSLCLHVVASVIGQTFTQGAEWVEETITLE